MSTHPYIPWYVDDYDAHTAHLTPAQDGIYGRLLRLTWRTPGCSLPNDEVWIARKVRLSKADWERIGKGVLAEFFRLQRGRFIQKRLKAEYDHITRKKSARVAAGSKGGSAKALNNKRKGSSKTTDLLGDTRAFPEPEGRKEGSKKPSFTSRRASADERAVGSSPPRSEVIDLDKLREEIAAEAARLGQPKVMPE